MEKRIIPGFEWFGGEEKFQEFDFQQIALIQFSWLLCVGYKTWHLPHCFNNFPT
jgi:hypothetical protein